MPVFVGGVTYGSPVTTLPPPPPPRTTDQPSAIPPPTGAQILRALKAPALGYAALLLGAILLMLLIVVAANVGSTGAETGVESDDTNAIGVLIGMPFQIAAMALLGSLGFSEDGLSASLFLPPLILTALYTVTTGVMASKGEVLPRSGTRALLAVLVGFVTATVITPLTWALAMRADGSAVDAASVSLFFGVWVLTGIALFAGASRAAGATRPEWLPSEYTAAARVWCGSRLVWLVVAVVVLTVVAAVKSDLWVAILAPIWGVTAGVYTYSLAHFGSLSYLGERLDIGDLSAPWTIVLVLGAVALAAATSIAWHLRRDTSAANLAQQIGRASGRERV